MAAPQITEEMAMKRMSPRRCALVRSTRGSRNPEKNEIGLCIEFS